MAAHETSADFAKLLLLPEFSNKKAFWKEAFTFVTGKTLEELAEECVQKEIDLSVVGG
jgi:hypothetical protein